MKETIKYYFPLILTALCAIFAIYIMFHSITDVGMIFSDIAPKDLQTSIAKQMDAQPKKSFPIPKYIGTSLCVGEANSFADLFVLEDSEGSILSVKASDDTALYLVDITSESGTSMLTKLSSENMNMLEEIPSAAVYDTDNHLLYFYNSGIYTFYVRLYYDHRPGILFECQVPVEVR